jgi:hypothetical protein
MNEKIMMIEESLYEFSKRGRPKKGSKKSSKKMRGIDAPDSWGDVESEDEEVLDDIDVSDMTNAEEIEVEEDVFDDKLQRALSNEVKIPEFSRRVLRFRLKENPRRIINGVPMAKMGSGNAFLFKLDNGKMKKIFLRNIIVEQEKRNDGRAYFINEKFKEDSDPVHDMHIGPQGIVYRCGNCRSLVDEDGDPIPEGEESENAQAIIKAFGEQGDHIKYIWCSACEKEEYYRQREEEMYREKEREQEEREKEEWERDQEQEEREREEQEERERQEEEWRRRQEEERSGQDY